MIFKTTSEMENFSYLKYINFSIWSRNTSYVVTPLTFKNALLYVTSKLYNYMINIKNIKVNLGYC